MPAGSGRAVGRACTPSSLVVVDVFPVRPSPKPAAGVARGSRYELDSCDNRGWPGRCRRRAGDATMSSSRVLLPLHTRPKVRQSSEISILDIVAYPPPSLASLFSFPFCKSEIPRCSFVNLFSLAILIVKSLHANFDRVSVF